MGFAGCADAVPRTPDALFFAVEALRELEALRAVDVGFFVLPDLPEEVFFPELPEREVLLCAIMNLCRNYLSTSERMMESAPTPQQ